MRKGFERVSRFPAIPPLPAFCFDCTPGRWQMKTISSDSQEEGGSTTTKRLREVGFNCSRHLLFFFLLIRKLISASPSILSISDSKKYISNVEQSNCLTALPPRILVPRLLSFRLFVLIQPRETAPGSNFDPSGEEERDGEREREKIKIKEYIGGSLRIAGNGEGDQGRTKLHEAINLGA